jgi:hypothetical protein
MPPLDLMLLSWCDHHHLAKHLQQGEIRQQPQLHWLERRQVQHPAKDPHVGLSVHGHTQQRCYTWGRL